MFFESFQAINFGVDRILLFVQKTGLPVAVAGRHLRIGWWSWPCSWWMQS